MSKTKVAITIDETLLNKLDQLVAQHRFPNRSRAIQVAVQEKIARLDRNRLAKECANLDPSYEKAMAEEGLSGELDQWPEY